MVGKSFKVEKGKIILENGQQLVRPEGVVMPVKPRKERRTGISRNEEILNRARNAQDLVVEAVEPVLDQAVEPIPDVDALPGVSINPEKGRTRSRRRRIDDGLPSPSAIRRSQDRTPVDKVSQIDFDQTK